jgi:hypothetical protein
MAKKKIRYLVLKDPAKNEHIWKLHHKNSSLTWIYRPHYRKLLSQITRWII